MRWRPIALALLLAPSSACEGNPVVGIGQFGRPIDLASGDGSTLPRLAYTPDACPGEPGGCSEGTCELLLVDTLASLTVLPHGPDAAGASDLDFVERSCLEVRTSRGLAAEAPATEDLDGAVTRFRFEDVPTVYAPRQGGSDWTWTAGDQTASVEPAGVLGGNVLAAFSVAFTGDTITFYGEFPGTERNLADQGRAFLPVQFPGRLLGQELGDRCDIDGESCLIAGFSIAQGQRNIALRRSKMVLDACVAAPPCTVGYIPPPSGTAGAGTCTQTPGPDVPEDQTCVGATDPVLGGRSASLVVASGVPGMVLFTDSASRMFGPLDALPECAAVTEDALACRVGQEGRLYVSGWPAAGDPELGQEPLVQLRVRSLALVPGGTTARTLGPCERAQNRLDALFDQCDRFRKAVDAVDTIADSRPPYSSNDDANDGTNHQNDAGATSVAILGETRYADGTTGPTPDAWIDTLVVPEIHPLPLALRRDVAPEAIEVDGLIGTALFDGTSTILDYTDQNPAVRLSCLDPRSGNCLVAPDCRADGQGACCFGLPLPLVVDFITEVGDDTCCRALSAEELAEIQAEGFCSTAGL